MRILIVYDCLFPYTIGGGERWYRNLAERLTVDGHEVTYLTLRQWDRGARVDLPGADVRIAGPRMALYADGRRKIAPPLLFGAGVLWHLVRHGRSYDIVHTASFPFFSLLAAALVRPLHRYGLVVDWFELWSRAYWRDYLGAAGGRVGWAVQKLCLRVPQRAFTLAQATAVRLRAEGVHGDVEVLTGLQDVSDVEVLTGLQDVPPATPTPQPARPEVVFAGRHIPEKRVPALVRGFAALHERAPELRLVVYGDGPDRPEVLALIESEGLGDVASAPGFVAREELEARLASALCMVLPSRREGYGLVVVEASARGVPSIVIADADNAATELVDEGENGFVAASAEPQDIADAILRVRAAGAPLRASTAAWFERNRDRLSLTGSLDRVAAAYGDDRAPSARS
jgi:glycosyltransferase involved in cell wall biosynthesis